MDKCFQKIIVPTGTRKVPAGPWHQCPVFRKYQDIPADRRKDVTYGRVVVDYRPQKEDPNRTRLTVGGDRIKYPGNISTPTAALTTAKLVINSTISTPQARYMYCDLGNFYLGTPIDRYEYIRLSINISPQNIIDAYNSTEKNIVRYEKIPSAKNWTNWHKEGPSWPMAPTPGFSKISGHPSQTTQRRHIWTGSRGLPTAKGGSELHPTHCGG